VAVAVAAAVVVAETKMTLTLSPTLLAAGYSLVAAVLRGMVAAAAGSPSACQNR
jgi:hypothetical protein